MMQWKALNEMDLLTLNVLELPLHQQVLIKRTLENTKQVDLGKRLGLTQEQVSAIERGKCRIPVECLAEIIRYLYKDGGSNEK
ncbi:helix-turn-helix domain-containing protein [Bacillus wiedmannii]|uniref:helix-turn-helix domain-containing protein n=1 Tax=Bacillus wiedmannii TaxID=1890302 RepID=UPI0010BDEB38|nr:helix-turn-helix transcriptional regulator [Bacillus wiedmannii]TKH20280.1 helix-turn-helix domain-containing protein [Bacillus wiedmannii]